MTKDTRVVMLTPNFFPYVGGAEKQALELSKSLSERGIGVRVLTRRLKGLAREESVSGIPVHRTLAAGGGRLNSICFMVSSLLFLLLRRADYDVIHVHLAGSPAVAACLAARLLGRRVVVKVGGGRGIGEIALSSRTLAGRLKLGLLRLLRPRFVSVIQDLADEMAEHGLGSGVRVIPNGVDTDRYRPASFDRKSRLREELGWPRGLLFLYVGRLAIEKRLVPFLDAFAQAFGAGKPEEGSPSFMLVGSGPEEDNVRLAVRRFNLDGRARIVPQTDRIERCYAAADVFVLPSISEGLSNALLEAMASGLAVLGTRVGGTKEAVEDDATGLLFEPPDQEALRALLGRLRDEPELAPRLGAAGRARAEKLFALGAVADRYIKLYNG